MGDLLADINAAIGASALAGQVKAIRYGLGNQFQFVAADGTRQMTFSADSAATHDTLHFGNGTDAFDANDIFKVTARSRGGTFFVQNATLEASATLALSDLNLAADIGFVGIKTNGLAGSVTVNAGITLEDGRRQHALRSRRAVQPRRATAASATSCSSISTARRTRR